MKKNVLGEFYNCYVIFVLYYLEVCSKAIDKI